MNMRDLDLYELESLDGKVVTVEQAECLKDNRFVDGWEKVESFLHLSLTDKVSETLGFYSLIVFVYTEYEVIV